MIRRNRYSVPYEFAGQMLSTRLYPGRVVVVGDDAVVAEHDPLADEGLVRYDWQHYIPLILRKPGALSNGAPFLDMPEPLQRPHRALQRARRSSPSESFRRFLPSSKAMYSRSTAVVFCPWRAVSDVSICVLLRRKRVCNPVLLHWAYCRSPPT